MVAEFVSPGLWYHHPKAMERASSGLRGETVFPKCWGPALLSYEGRDQFSCAGVIGVAPDGIIGVIPIPGLVSGEASSASRLRLQHTWFAWASVLTWATDNKHRPQLQQNHGISLSGSLHLSVTMAPGGCAGHSDCHGPCYGMALELQNGHRW